MASTRDFTQTVVERVQRDPAFAQALIDEALMLDDEPVAALLRALAAPAANAESALPPEA